MSGAVTEYGFTWEHVEVTRACKHKGSVWLVVKTPRQELEVRVTPSGAIRTRVVKRKAAPVRKEM